LAAASSTPRPKTLTLCSGTAQSAIRKIAEQLAFSLRLLVAWPTYLKELGKPRCWRSTAASDLYETRLKPGGLHVPSPAGRIDGDVVFGQYSRIAT